MLERPQQALSVLCHATSYGHEKYGLRAQVQRPTVTQRTMQRAQLVDETHAEESVVAEVSESIRSAGDGNVSHAIISALPTTLRV